MKTNIDALRVFLFFGLIFHKILWEVLKRKRKTGSFIYQNSPSFVGWVLKSIKVLVLVFLLVQTLFLDLFPISEQPNMIRVIGIGTYVLGLLIAVVGRIHLGANWMDLEDYHVSSNQALITNGIYRYVRHPIYGGDILLLIGLQLALNSWLVLGVAAIVVVVIRQSILEESLLSQTFPAYQGYCSRTKRFIPFLV